MAATKQNEGLNQLDQGLLNKVTSGLITLHLNKNSFSPAVTDTFASNPNAEPANTGYASVPLTGSSWTSSAPAARRLILFRTLRLHSQRMFSPRRCTATI